MKSRLIVLAAAILVLLGALAYRAFKPAPVAFNPTCSFHVALLLPGNAPTAVPSSQSIHQALAQFEKIHPDWKSACDQARKLATDPRLNLKIQSRAEFQLPDEAYLRKMGVDLSETDRQVAGSTQVALHARMESDPSKMGSDYPAFQALMLALAQERGACLYVVNSRLVYTPIAFSQIRLDLNHFRLAHHVLIQSYVDSTGLPRMVTMGMSLFGCPDLEIRGYFPQDSHALKLYLHGAARHLVAFHILDPKAELPSSICLPIQYVKTIGDATLVPASGDGIRAVVVGGHYDPGDPQLNIIQILPPKETGEDMSAWGSSLSRQLTASPATPAR